MIVLLIGGGGLGGGEPPPENEKPRGQRINEPLKPAKEWSEDNDFGYLSVYMPVSVEAIHLHLVQSCSDDGEDGLRPHLHIAIDAQRKLRPGETVHFSQFGYGIVYECLMIPHEDFDLTSAVATGACGVVTIKLTKTESGRKKYNPVVDIVGVGEDDDEALNLFEAYADNKVPGHTVLQTFVVTNAAQETVASAPVRKKKTLRLSSGATAGERKDKR